MTTNNGRMRALLLGDNGPNAPWHPLEPARLALEEILGAEWELEATEDYDRMAGLSRNEYGLFVSYADCWSRKPEPAQIAGLLQYVAGGGGLMIVHNGISLHGSHELAQLMGGKFTGHPPYQGLVYHEAREDGQHPVMAGIGGFEMDEEPYMFEFDSFTPRKVFLEFEFEGARYPAGWSHEYGLGRVLYVQPGHHAPSFKPDAYRRLLRRAALWTADRL